METNENKWILGEIVTLGRKEKMLKKSGSTVYERFIRSRYICIREANERQQGILMKVLGKSDCKQIRIVNGQPFCKDDHEKLFEGDCYFSYSFPSANEVKEVLEIIRSNQHLLQKLENASMHINPDSTFWVNDISRNMLFLKKPQYYNARDGLLSLAKDNSNHYRITLVYFRPGKMLW